MSGDYTKNTVLAAMQPPSYKVYKIRLLNQKVDL